MRIHCTANLLKTLHMLKSITDEDYQCKIESLSGSSIGQHVRHIAEFYHCLLVQESNGVVNYDKRERNLQLETSKTDAMEAILNLNSAINNISAMETDLVIEASYPTSSSSCETLRFSSTLGRELAYCFEHSIHHQALIAVALKHLGKDKLVDADFGFAPSTITYLQANR